MLDLYSCPREREWRVISIFFAYKYIYIWARPRDIAKKKLISSRPVRTVDFDRFFFSFFFVSFFANFLLFLKYFWTAFREIWESVGGRGRNELLLQLNERRNIMRIPFLEPPIHAPAPPSISQTGCNSYIHWDTHTCFHMLQTDILDVIWFSKKQVKKKKKQVSELNSFIEPPSFSRVITDYLNFFKLCVGILLYIIQSRRGLAFLFSSSPTNVLSPKRAMCDVSNSFVCVCFDGRLCAARRNAIWYLI